MLTVWGKINVVCSGTTQSKRQYDARMPVSLRAQCFLNNNPWQRAKSTAIHVCPTKTDGEERRALPSLSGTYNDWCSPIGYDFCDLNFCPDDVCTVVHSKTLCPKF